MSFIASKWARSLDLHRTPKAVLGYLAEVADNRTFGCYAGQPKIAKHTGFSERTVRSALRYLTEVKVITREPRRCGEDGPVRKGYRTTDYIELMVSDDPLVPVYTYSEWTRLQQQSRAAGISPATHVDLTGNSRRSHRQQLPCIKDQVKNQLKDQVEARTQVALSQEEKLKQEEEAQEAQLEEAPLNEKQGLTSGITRTLIEAVPTMSDDILFETYVQILEMEGLEEVPGGTELAVLLFQEQKRRFGGVS